MRRQAAPAGAVDEPGAQPEPLDAAGRPHRIDLDAQAVAGWCSCGWAGPARKRGDGDLAWEDALTHADDWLGTSYLAAWRQVFGRPGSAAELPANPGYAPGEAGSDDAG
jgi:hypothetical protein